MKCPSCSSEMTPVEGVAFYTAIEPQSVFECSICKSGDNPRRIMVFTVEGVENDLLVWMDEVPMGYPFTSFIEERIAAHRQKAAFRRNL